MTIPFWTAQGTIDLADIRPADLTAEILGDTLAKLNRFGGRTREPWSVAAHSVLVERLCLPDLGPWGLLHDAHEAFLGDFTAPAVELICRAGTRSAVEHAIRNAKGQLDRIIASAWGTSPRGLNIHLRRADLFALQAEAVVFMGVRPELAHPSDADEVDRAVGLLIEMEAARDWRAARDLWLSRVEHYAGLGRLIPPKTNPRRGIARTSN
ncbi:hypothetical protein [Ruixingdingia sedimenti]|uniref:HD domain-containing protein n=1 Tax=Ruixingdingia sedimenti TaxID=3073604 RepID=A0ABU1FEC9_9RHOB|nr:hypothetical protein [Xinfangfangia sp. LG-4]MDR5655225.1 hypothetical protein [Xinfangfangia sp. LG-4]